MRVWCTTIIFWNLSSCDAFQPPTEGSFIRQQSQTLLSRRWSKKTLDEGSEKSEWKIPPNVAVYKDEKTGNDVYILGCLHGAPSSSQDVEELVGAVQPSAVVVELCNARYKTLREDMLAEEKPEQASDNKEENRPQPNPLVSWVQGVAKTYQKKGPASAILAAAISFVYLLQSLSRFDPGVEFKTAVTAAESSKAEIVLGDQDVYETLDSLGKGFRPPTRKVLLQEPNYLIATAIEDFKLLLMSVFGPTDVTYPQKLNVPLVICQNRRLLVDLIFLLAPALILVFGLTDGVSLLMNPDLLSAGALPSSIEAATSVPAAADSARTDLLDAICEDIITVGALVFTSRFFRLVIAERDAYLASSIKDACQRHPGKPVVAVLGLLHCNGVAENLRKMEE